MSEVSFTLEPQQGSFSLPSITAYLGGRPSVVHDGKPSGNIAPGAQRFLLCGNAACAEEVKRLRQEQPERALAVAYLDVSPARIQVFQWCTPPALSEARTVLEWIAAQQPVRILDEYQDDVTAAGIAGLYADD